MSLARLVCMWREPMLANGFVAGLPCLAVPDSIWYAIEVARLWRIYRFLPRHAAGERSLISDHITSLECSAVQRSHTVVV